VLLEVAEHGEQILRLRIAVRSEHPHQALCGDASRRGEPLEAQGGVDVIAQDCLARRYVSGQERLDTLAQQRLPESRIAGEVRAAFSDVNARANCALAERRLCDTL
jgi:hypothetical protein